jgi:thioredoxin-dependent peroxiredoxin
MRVVIVVLSLSVGAGTSLMRAQCVPAATPGTRVLNIGDVAPDFSLPASDGRQYRLSEYRGRQPVVLVWFAKAFTGG